MYCCRYGHLNNSSYYLIADSIINAYLVERCGIQPFLQPHSHSHSTSSSSSTSSAAHSGEKGAHEIVGVVISNSCRYFASCSFPSPLMVRLRVVKLGKSSVTYQVSISEAKHGEQERSTAALITSTHVFVDRVTRRPVTMPAPVKDSLHKILVPIDHAQTTPSSKL